jgi:putative transposase
VKRFKSHHWFGYFKVKGEWGYLYRAVDSHGDTLDFMLSERRDEDAATAFFKQAINNNGLPDEIRVNYLRIYP